jgi:hypothetical protein
LKLLLASAGITNASIQDALLGLLGWPIASYGHARWRTTIKVTDDGVEVISEGHWRLFER